MYVLFRLICIISFQFEHCIHGCTHCAISLKVSLMTGVISQVDWFYVAFLLKFEIVIYILTVMTTLLLSKHPHPFALALA